MKKLIAILALVTSTIAFAESPKLFKIFGQFSKNGDYYSISTVGDDLGLLINISPESATGLKECFRGTYILKYEKKEGVEIQSFDIVDIVCHDKK